MQHNPFIDMNPRTYSIDSSNSWCILLRSLDLMRFIWEKVLSTAALLNGRARTDNANFPTTVTTLKSCSPLHQCDVIVINRPKIRTRQSKLATRRNVKFPRQLSPKLAQFGGKTAKLATLPKWVKRSERPSSDSTVWSKAGVSCRGLRWRTLAESDSRMGRVTGGKDSFWWLVFGR